jgi:hypothetical protein
MSVIRYGDNSPTLHLELEVCKEGGVTFTLRFDPEHDEDRNFLEIQNAGGTYGGQSPALHEVMKDFILKHGSAPVTGYHLQGEVGLAFSQSHITLTLDMDNNILVFVREAFVETDYMRCALWNSTLVPLWGEFAKNMVLAIEKDNQAYPQRNRKG